MAISKAFLSTMLGPTLEKALALVLHTASLLSIAC